MFVDSYFCLCCLSTDDLSNLFDKSFECNCAELLKDLFNISLSQESSQDDYICKECIKNLKQANNFKSQVLKSIESLEVVGVIRVQKINEVIYIDKSPSIIEKESKNLSNNENLDLTEDTKVLSTATNEKVKTEIDTEIIENADTIHAFLANEPVNKLEKDGIIPPIIKTERENSTPSASNYRSELEGSSYQCKICGEKFLNLYTINVHINKHFPNHICEVCGKGYLTEKKLKRHKYCHDSGPFVCQECGLTFTNYNTYSGHVLRKHTRKLLYKCPECHERFPSIEARARHALNSHNTRARHACRHCSKVFLTAGRLASHIKFKHEKLKRHVCDRCGARFFSKQDLVGHTAYHSGVNIFKCDFCDKSYPRKNALTVHLKTHTNERKFGCETCGRRFIQKCSLLRHMKTHNRVKKREHSKSEIREP